MDKFSNFFENHMRSNIQNYLNLTVDEVYNVITDINAWPGYFNERKKLRLLKSMIEHYIEKEDYEKCAKLQKQIDELENRKQADRHVRNITN